MVNNHCLVVTGTMEWIMTFHSVGNVMIPIDYVFKDGLKPPTIFSQPSMVSMRYAWVKPLIKMKREVKAVPKPNESTLPDFMSAVFPAPVAELSADLTPMSYVLSGTMWDMSDM